jgi:hypothetical protein
MNRNTPTSSSRSNGSIVCKNRKGTVSGICSVEGQKAVVVPRVAQEWQHNEQEHSHQQQKIQRPHRLQKLTIPAIIHQNVYSSEYDVF